MLTGKNFNEKMYRAAEITRELLKDNKTGYTSTPLENIKKIFPDLRKYWNELTELGVVLQFKSLYLPYVYNVETFLAAKIKKLLTDPPYFYIKNFNDLGDNLSGELSNNNLSSDNLSSEQKLAVKKCLSNNISVLTGGAGTGKSSTIKAIINVLKKNQIEYRISSFTGKAVARIKDLIGNLDVKINKEEKDVNEQDKEPCTLHMMIQKDKTRNIKQIFKCLILDECSMITMDLLYEFMQVYTHNYSIIFIGDKNQLPAIGWGNFFYSLTESPLIPISQLFFNFRSDNQQTNSQEKSQTKNINGIIKNAEYILNYKEGEFDFIEASNFKIIEGNYTHVSGLIGILNRNNIPLEEIVVLSPYNKDLEKLNSDISSLYNKDNESITEKINGKEKIWRINDRVMYTDNNYTYKLTNGSEGIVTNIDYKKNKISVTFTHSVNSQTLKFLLNNNTNTNINTNTNTNINKKKLNTKDLILSFAVSVHRYQGSEKNYVIGYIPSVEDEYKTGNSFLNSNLMYTLITRARKILWLIGDIKVIHDASSNKSEVKQCHLIERLSVL